MSIKTLEISGLRGFASAQTLRLAIPNGRAGSGLTVLVGPNNGGKSTVIEAWKALSRPEGPSFAIGKRNHKTGDRITITAVDDSGNSFRVRTVDGGGSETVFEKQVDLPGIFVVPSRRFFSPSFGQQSHTRQSYIAGYALPPVRGTVIEQFAGRLFEIQKNREAFDSVLKRVLDPLPAWAIDQSEAGYFLRFEVKDTYHSSEGLGEGLISLFFIIDALYDAPEGSIIVIDEPELSLHPPLQRRLSLLFAEWSKTRQLIIATHSPYFIDFQDVCSGSQVARVHLHDLESTISCLSDDTVKELCGFLNNLHNPHILGIDAREVFFLFDGVILVEGQEDVVYYRKIAKDLAKQFAGEFFGWGVGGAGNMMAIASLLKDLGFARVVGILDGNKKDRLKPLEDKFPEYTFFVIPTDDIRTKPARAAVPEVGGLLDAKGALKSEHKDAISALLDSVNKVLS